MKYTLDSIIRETKTALRKSTLAAGLAASLFFGCSSFDTSALQGGREGEAEGERDAMIEKYDGVKGKRGYDGGMDADGETKSNGCNKQLFFLDSDNDGFGNKAYSLKACKQEQGYVANSDDCNDDNEIVYPNAQEICDGLDNNCDKIIDENLKPPSQECFAGVGTCRRSGLEYRVCGGKAGWSSDYRNCNAVAGTPREEICDELDNDCDREVDEGAAPVLEWFVTHGGSAEDSDGGNGVVVDHEGNVYVVGYETVIGEDLNIMVNKYDSDGNPLWGSPISYNDIGNHFGLGNGIAVDRLGNIYVIGEEFVEGESTNIWINKYNTDGVPLWLNHISYDEAFGGDRGTAIAVTSSGNISVLGFVNRSAWIHKYNINGNPLWDRPNYYDGGYSAIALDGEDNIYVVGTVSGGTMWVNKYNSSGTPIWANPLLYDGGTEARGNDIAFDVENDTFYVTGSLLVEGEGRNILVNKYNSNGIQLWDEPVTYNGSRWLSEDNGVGIALDSEGNVCVTGYEESTEDSGYTNIWTNKYDPNGTPLWPAPLIYDHTAEVSSDMGDDIVIDPEGNIYVTGSVTVLTRYPRDDKDLWLGKYSCNSDDE